MRCLRSILPVLSLILAFQVGVVLPAQTVEKRPWKLDDAKRFKSVSGTAFSPDGKWLGTLLRSSASSTSRGMRRAGRTGTLLLYSTNPLAKKKEITGVTGFRFMKDSGWLLYTQRQATPDKSKKKTEKRPRSERWKRMMERLKKSGGGASTPAPESGSRPSRTLDLTLEALGGKKKYALKAIREYTLSEDGRYLFYVKSDDAGKNAILVHDRKGMNPSRDKKIVEGKDSLSGLAWKKERNALWFYSNRDLAKSKAKAKPKTKAKAKPKTKPKPKARPGSKKKEKSGEKEKGKTPGSKTVEDGEKKKTPPARPSRLWSWSLKSKKLRPLAGPGVGKGFPENQTLAGASSRMSRFMRGRTIPARFMSRMGRRFSGGGVRLAKDGKRLFVYTMEPRRSTSTVSTPRPPGSSPQGPRPRPARETRRLASAEPPPADPPAAGAAPPKPDVVIWHWKDKKVPTEASKRRARPSRTLFEMDLKTGAYRKLSDGKVSMSLSPDESWLLGYDAEPYGAYTSWDRNYSDVYLTSVKTLKKKKLFEKFSARLRWTSDGKYLIWFTDGDWHAMRAADPKPRNLTKGMGLKLGERGHGGGVLMPDKAHVLIQDEHDVWKVSLEGKTPVVNLTKIGRRDDIRFRPVALWSEAGKTDTELYFEKGERLYLEAFNNQTKSSSYHVLNLASGKLRKLVEMDRTLSRPRRAEKGDLFHFTVQDFDQYPDLWISDREFRDMRRVTRANPWLSEIDLPKNVLVEWRNLDGKPLQGILTLPCGYTSGKRYPMIVYIYEKLSHNLHRFRAPKLVYSSTMWAAEGYAVFQPDIIYDIGHPGPSSVKCVLPGVEKVVDMGIADSDRVGLIGHSWGGYETAYIITRTRRFAAAVAGAPVVNMTSAYNGIRWQTGKPRQFQYERSQSRIGGSLWEYPERYVENSPVFHLEKVKTPVLILFGDNDGAVPWYQGIEYMLAMRRLGKQAVFLQYKNEAHGLRKEHNKKDYDRRVLEWFNHFLKDAKPAKWIVKPQN